MSQGYFFLNRVKLNSFKGEIMKFIYTLIGCLLLAACSTSDNSDDQSMSQSPVVEYVWQTKGPNYSDDALESLIEFMESKSY
jgi:ABC-type glycerol-3-phosphate transport system substrate-binding protein